MARPSAVLLGMSISLMTSVPTFGQVSVARADTEFRELMPFVDGWSEHRAGDEELFIRWVLPYGPLDLRVTKATHAEAGALRNFYLGYVANRFGMMPYELSQRWFCGPSCVVYRRQLIADNLEEISKAVSEFRSLRRIELVAQWSVTNEYRIDNVFSIRGQHNATSPSPTMGFVPSGSWTPVASMDSYVRQVGDDPAVVHAILARMRAIGLAAIVREGDDVRVVRIGFADNEAGAVFTNKATALSVGTELPDGATITHVERLAEGVYFYETS